MSPASSPDQVFAGGVQGQENQESFGKQVGKAAGQPDTDTYECQTCKNRRYQDGSNDPSVSFKMPTKLSPERAAFAVRSHEMEHVAHAKLQALRDRVTVSHLPHRHLPGMWKKLHRRRQHQNRFPLLTGHL